MSDPTIHGKRRALSASDIRDAIARDLMQIKMDDRLTFADLGGVLRKSDDQAAKYCDGTATMDAITYVIARDTWNGRFTGRVDALVNSKPDDTCDRSKQSRILKAALTLSIALEDGEIDVREIHENRATLEHAQDAIAGLLSRIGPKEAQA